MGASIVCVLLWLIYNREAASRQNIDVKSPELERETGFWNAAKYAVSAQLLPLLLEDQKSNAAVTLGVQGHEVPLSVALDHDSPVLPMEIIGNTSQQYLATNHSSDSGDLRILIAVTSTCCTLQAQYRRNAIRKSWMSTLSKAPQPVDVKFVLAQPNVSSIADAHQLLQAEVHHQDILFVRNTEMYTNLPKKTLNIMRYASKAFPR